jgi:hypothetical protein
MRSSFAKWAPYHNQNLDRCKEHKDRNRCLPDSGVKTHHSNVPLWTRPRPHPQSQQSFSQLTLVQFTETPSPPPSGFVRSQTCSRGTSHQLQFARLLGDDALFQCFFFGHEHTITGSHSNHSRSRRWYNLRWRISRCSFDHTPARTKQYRKKTKFKATPIRRKSSPV